MGYPVAQQYQGYNRDQPSRNTLVNTNSLQPGVGILVTQRQLSSRGSQGKSNELSLSQNGNLPLEKQPTVTPRIEDITTNRELVSQGSQTYTNEASNDIRENSTKENQTTTTTKSNDVESNKPLKSSLGDWRNSW
ncbi:unnamed protein product [Meganyctiphanes norvegica]|uniref:Uncharacterized protein n=1 Tax=Meganyctiphanes norvegica TaxID=48144 RepID=A0AAV2QDS8_MEGNR